MKKIFIGIDLAGSEKRNTGFCIMDENLNIKTFIVKTDKDIFRAIFSIKQKPKIIAIDAPLSLPLMRKNLDKKENLHRKEFHFRKCDLELYSLKIKFFPITLGPMRKLTKRGIKIKKTLERKGYEVIEVFPGGAQDLLKIPRKQKGIDKLKKGLKKLGIKGLKKRMSGDELDAITCAFVGKCYVDGNYFSLGNKREGLIIMPKLI